MENEIYFKKPLQNKEIMKPFVTGLLFDLIFIVRAELFFGCIPHPRAQVCLSLGSFNTEVSGLTRLILLYVCVSPRHNKAPVCLFFLIKQTKKGERKFLWTSARKFQRETEPHGSPETAGGGGLSRRRPREAEPLHCQPHADGVPALLRQSHGAPLPRLRDWVPGPQYQLGTALHGDGHLVEEEPPVEGRPDRNRHRIREQRNPGGPQGTAKCLTDGIVGM